MERRKLVPFAKLKCASKMFVFFTSYGCELIFPSNVCSKNDEKFRRVRVKSIYSIVKLTHCAWYRHNQAHDIFAIDIFNYVLGKIKELKLITFYRYLSQFWTLWTWDDRARDVHVSVCSSISDDYDYII